MNWLAKVVSPPGSRGAAERLQGTSGHARESSHGQGTLAVAGARAEVRQSNGLKEFLWLLEDVKGGRLLDLGAASQATVNFFVQRGFRRVSAEDLLGGWSEFTLRAGSRPEEACVPEAADPAARAAWHAERAARFLEGALRYSAEEFDGILAWDIFELLEEELLTQVVSRLYSLLRPGGALLAIFHAQPPESGQRFRVVEGGIETLGAPRVAFPRRHFQNREILNLFAGYRSSKTFVGRDQLREGLILK